MRLIIKLELTAFIAVVSLIFFTEIVTQQPQGIVTNVSSETFQKSPIAAGVTVATALFTVSPSSCNATVIGSTVPPVAIAILPLNVIR